MKRAAGTEAGVPGAGGKRRGGRRGKLAWRKHVNIDDVHAFLEEQRLEQRLGPAQLKSDGELFAVDTAGDEQLQHARQLSEQPVLSSKQRRRAALAEPPRCYRVLQNTSAVADPSGVRNTVRAAGARAGALAQRSLQRRTSRGTDERRARERDVELNKWKLRRTRARTSRRRYDTDVWTQELCERRIEPSLVSEWLDAAVVQHHTPPARRASRPAGPPPRPAPPPVPAPHPGQSYNPSYNDHQALLAEIADKENLLIKKEKHLERVTTALYKRVRPEKAQSEWVEEMMSGLPGAGAEQVESDCDGEYRSVNPPVRNKRKADKTRRNRKLQQQELQQARQRRLDKKKIADIYKLRFLEAALVRADERLSRARAVRTARRSARLAATPPALNAHKHKPHDEAFLAPSELAPALRQHPPSGNLLKERWESLQRRGALAPSKIFLRKKLRLKRFWKPGHKVTRADVDKCLTSKQRPKAKLE